MAIANESALTSLEGLRQGFLLVDAAARPLYANRVARRLLDASDGLQLEAGALSASDADGGLTLRGLIGSCSADTITGSGGDIVLRREAGRMPLGVLVTPIGPETANILWTFPQRPVAIVLVTDPEAGIQDQVESLRERFGFTPAEAAFAVEIVKGDGRQATADRLGITVGTARSHLSKIFEKTGVTLQAELVRRLLQK